MDAEAPDDAFVSFANSHGARLRRVLVAHYGMEVGGEVTNDALLWAWEHWETVASMDSPVGYLYRVAQSSARRHRRWARRVVLPVEPAYEQAPPPEPGLHLALTKLPPAQRVAVLLVHGLGWSYQEAADAMSVPVSTVTNHLHRGLLRLRRSLGVTADG